jgi:uncharacterized membrane protein YecN with MAPEG domain
MIIPTVTAIYTAVLALLFVSLSLRVAYARWQTHSYLGEDDKHLARLVRAHANFAENVPFAVILIGLSEMLGASPVALHLFGASLLIGRVSHAYAISRDNEPIWFRVTGYTITASVIAISSLTILYLATIR